MQLVSYLGFDGDCRQAFEFYAKTLGGQVVAMITMADMGVDMPHSPKNAHLIMHARLIAGQAVLMGSDAPPPHFSEPQGMHVSIMLDDTAEAERIYNALAEGAEITM